MKSQNWRSQQANKARRKLPWSPQFRDRALRFSLVRVMNGLINVFRNSRRRWSRAGSEFQSLSLQARLMDWKIIRTIWLTMRHLKVHPAVKCQDVYLSPKHYHSKTRTKLSIQKSKNKNELSESSAKNVKLMRKSDRKTRMLDLIEERSALSWTWLIFIKETRCRMMCSISKILIVIQFWAISSRTMQHHWINLTHLHVYLTKATTFCQ